MRFLSCSYRVAKYLQSTPLIRLTEFSQLLAPSQSFLSAIVSCHANFHASSIKTNTRLYHPPHMECTLHLWWQFSLSLIPFSLKNLKEWYKECWLIKPSNWFLCSFSNHSWFNLKPNIQNHVSPYTVPVDEQAHTKLYIYAILVLAHCHAVLI